MIAYEDKIRQGGSAAIRESFHFFEDGERHYLFYVRLANALKTLGISYAMFDCISLSVYGVSSVTERISILVTNESLQRMKPHAREIGLLDSEVKVGFYITGRFPGDGEEKPVAFPDPATCAVEIDGVSYVKLENAIELKLAAGMSSISYIHNLADVIELIKARSLGEDFADKLNPYVREKYLELCRAVRNEHDPFAKQ